MQEVYVPVSRELCVIENFVLQCTRFVIPQKLRSQTLTLAHERACLTVIKQEKKLRHCSQTSGKGQKTKLIAAEKNKDGPS